MTNKATRLMALSRIIPAVLLGGIMVASPDLASANPPTGFGTTNNTILNESCTLLQSIKGWLFGIVYVLGAIGLVLIAVSAFLGRFKFAHLIALGGGLFIVAAADLLIGFVTAGSTSASCTTGGGTTPAP
jgi:hypothetical protein